MKTEENNRWKPKTNNLERLNILKGREKIKWWVGRPYIGARATGCKINAWTLKALETMLDIT